jgi:hypothetical protein
MRLIMSFIVALLLANYSFAADIMPICAVADTKFDSTSISNNIPTRNNNPAKVTHTKHS